MGVLSRIGTTARWYFCNKRHAQHIFTNSTQKNWINKTSQLPFNSFIIIGLLRQDNGVLHMQVNEVHQAGRSTSGSWGVGMLPGAIVGQPVILVWVMRVGKSLHVIGAWSRSHPYGIHACVNAYRASGFREGTCACTRSKFCAQKWSIRIFDATVSLMILQIGQEEEW